MVRAVAALSLLLALQACGDPAGSSGPGSPPTQTSGAGAGEGWTRLPAGPLDGRVGATVVALDERRVLVVGGREWLCPPTADCVGPDEPPLADGALVDLGTGAWAPIADAPFGFSSAAAVVVDDGVFVVADPGDPFAGPRELLRYDVPADRWERLAPPTRLCSSLVRVPGGFAALCGSDENGEHPDRFYDVSADAWEDLPDDPLPPVYDRFGVHDGDRLLVFGSVIDGSEDQGKVAVALDLATRKWTRLPDAPGQGYQAWPAGDEVWLNPHFSRAGGGILDLATDSWRRLPELPPDEERPGDLAGIIGPEGATYEYADGWVRDTRTDRWLDVPPRGGTTYDESVAAAGQALVVFGGQDWGGEGGSTGRLVADLWVWRPPA